MTGVNGTLLPPVNPKVGKRAVKSGAFSFPDFVNPLPQEVTDTEDIQKLHARYNLVPYSGTTTESGDSLRDFFSSMAYLSPTHGSCIQSKKRYSLGKIEVVNRQDDDFELGQDREVGNDLARLFVDFLKSIDFGQKLRALACEFHEDFEETGDQWLEIIESRSLGEVKYACRRHAPSNVNYIASKKGEQRYAAISPAWTFDYLERYPPAVVPLFPAFMDMEDGTSRTIIHHKNGKNDWYGRPPAFSSWEYMYREFQDASYLVKVTHSNFTGQLILEVEDDNPELTEEEARKQGYRSEADRMQKNFSNEADDPQTILYMVRPSGSRPAFVKQIEPNTS
nr:hypothetical protein [Synergistaceae bacterium]